MKILSLFVYNINISHNSIIITPDIPPTDDTPSVQPFTGMCIDMYFPSRLTANIAQSPCNAVRNNERKNLFDLI